MLSERPFLAHGVAILLLSCLGASQACTRRGAGAAAPAANAPSAAAHAGGRAEAMEKFVSRDAAFVVYKPHGWIVGEQLQPGFQVLTVDDPAGEFEAAMFYGASPTGDDVPALAGLFGGRIADRFPDFRVTAAMVSPDRRRVAFDAAFSAPGKGRRELRVWVTGGEGQFVYSSIEAPAGRMAERRQLLLTILSN
ncbi:MAG TPA: hypothetical protein VLW17_11685, partial [Thermoanaerobaculaceae bacterium]|nr:hypothetical protein [Thermoanaerobaculaceae bacterium]